MVPAFQNIIETVRDSIELSNKSFEEMFGYEPSGTNAKVLLEALKKVSMLSFSMPTSVWDDGIRDCKDIRQFVNNKGYAINDQQGQNRVRFYVSGDLKSKLLEAEIVSNALRAIGSEYTNKRPPSKIEC